MRGGLTIQFLPNTPHFQVLSWRWSQSLCQWPCMIQERKRRYVIFMIFSNPPSFRWQGRRSSPVQGERCSISPRCKGEGRASQPWSLIGSREWVSDTVLLYFLDSVLFPSRRYPLIVRDCLSFFFYCLYLLFFHSYNTTGKTRIFSIILTTGLPVAG